MPINLFSDKSADKVNADSSETAQFCNVGFLSSVLGEFSNIDGTGNEAVHKSLDSNGSEILDSVSKSENTAVFIDLSPAIIEAKKLKEWLGTAKNKATRTKQLTEDAITADGVLTDEGENIKSNF